MSFEEELNKKGKELSREHNATIKFLEEIIELEKKWLLEVEKESYGCYKWHRNSKELGKIYKKYGQAEPSWSQPSFSCGKNFTKDELKKRIAEFRMKNEYIKERFLFIEIIWKALESDNCEFQKWKR